jgi:hypothetical protein
MPAIGHVSREILQKVLRHVDPPTLARAREVHPDVAANVEEVSDEFISTQRRTPGLTVSEQLIAQRRLVTGGPSTSTVIETGMRWTEPPSFHVVTGSGSTAVIADPGKGLAVIDLKEKQARAVLAVRLPGLKSLALSRDGSRLALGGSLGVASVDLETLSLQQLSQRPSTQLARDPGSDRLLSACAVVPLLSFQDFEDREPAELTSEDHPRTVAFSDSGKLVAAGDENAVMLWNAHDLEGQPRVLEEPFTPPGKLFGPMVESIAFVGDRSLVAATQSRGANPIANLDATDPVHQPIPGGRRMRAFDAHAAANLGVTGLTASDLDEATHQRTVWVSHDGTRALQLSLQGEVVLKDFGSPPG